VSETLTPHGNRYAKRGPHSAETRAKISEGVRAALAVPEVRARVGRPHRPAGIVYISGPMRGYFEDNYPAFHAAAAAWRRSGWKVLNPAEHFNGDHTRTFAEYMRVDIHDLLHATAIAMLPKWEASTGARRELLIAQTLGLAVYYADVPLQPFVHCPTVEAVIQR
jgi:hypothetical protein